MKDIEAFEIIYPKQNFEKNNFFKKLKRKGNSKKNSRQKKYKLLEKISSNIEINKTHKLNIEKQIFNLTTVIFL